MHTCIYIVHVRLLDEFVTPPSTPPPQNEAQPVSPTELSSALNKPHLLNIKTSKIKG